MARRYRSRRYRPRLGRRLRLRRSTLKRIKKDIMKCNFPTKVKFVGLTEKKVMFLTANTQINLKGGNGISFYLDPMSTENLSSILKEAPFGDDDDDAGTHARKFTIANWDKICILGIYIKFQPVKNTWVANGADEINTVKCTYTMNDFPYWDKAQCIEYDKECKSSKQIFTFNSNESFTMYVPAPTTMCSDSPCVHKSKTWWALANLVATIPVNSAGNIVISDEEEEDDSESEGGQEGGQQGMSRGMEEDDMIGATKGNLYYCSPEVSTPKNTVDDKPYIHAGRIHLESTGAKYNVTINYKVALKG